MNNVDIEIENDFANFKLRVNGILIRKDRVLSVQMQKNNFYCLPGGHIELFENSMDAIKREFKEETGYDTNVKELIAVAENFFTRKNGKKIHEISLYYLLEAIEDINIEDEYNIIEMDKNDKIYHHFKWIKLKELKNVSFQPKEIKEKIIEKNFNFEHFICN